MDTNLSALTNNSTVITFVFKCVSLSLQKPEQHIEFDNMTKFDPNKMIAHLQKKWGENTCQMCGSMQWNVSDTIYEMPEYQGSDDGQVLPVVPIACGNCGNTVFVNAFVSGVL